jgi:uncharacterized alpha-E superfamily protein
MWDALNGAYLELREIERKPRSEVPLPQLCDWTKRQGALFRGTTEGTHLQNDGYDFLSIGRFLERGDNTARLLEVKYYVLLPTTHMVGGSIDTYQWTTLLRALSSYRAFHWTYGGEYTPRKIAHFLILNRACPRSLLHCVQVLDAHLDRLAKGSGRTTAAHDRLRLIYAELADASVEDVINEGLHEFLTRFIHQSGAFGAELAESYLFGTP